MQEAIINATTTTLRLLVVVGLCSLSFIGGTMVHLKVQTSFTAITEAEENTMNSVVGHAMPVKGGR